LVYLGTASGEDERMSITLVMPSLAVVDLEQSVSWYTRLLGRGPDRRPMQGTAEWDLLGGGGVQLSVGIERAGHTVILGVDDVDAEVSALAERGLRLDASTEPSGQFRLAFVADPAGNTVIMSQRLGTGVTSPEVGITAR
jgi:catechol 2,3-dioxygenase-like lactoylglutathione lyase family enzyme